MKPDIRPPTRTQRALPALCLFLLIAPLVSGCSSPACRMWQTDDVLSKDPCFDSARLTLSSDSENPFFEAELLKSRSGIRLYVNILRYRAFPSPGDPSCVDAEILFDDSSDPWNVRLFLLEGDQRLLFPADVTETLVQALLAGKTFVIRFGKNSLSVISDNFPELYEKIFDIRQSRKPIYKSPKTDL